MLGSFLGKASRMPSTWMIAKQSHTDGPSLADAVFSRNTLARFDDIQRSDVVEMTLPRRSFHSAAVCDESSMLLPSVSGVN